MVLQAVCKVFFQTSLTGKSATYYLRDLKQLS